MNDIPYKMIYGTAFFLFDGAMVRLKDVETIERHGENATVYFRAIRNGAGRQSTFKCLADPPAVTTPVESPFKFFRSDTES